VETGEGLDELKDRLAQAAEQIAHSDRMRRVDSPFRMPIDRTFTIAGHGTVVTGSVASGRLKIGDELRIEPGGIEVRVRGIQNHDRTAEQVHRGQRAAINLAGVHHDKIVRGHELTSKGYLLPSRLITAQLSLLQSTPRPLKNRARVRIHVGTAEILSSVRLLDRQKIEPGTTAPVQLFLGSEAVTSWSQPFVVRSESPVYTIGGGRVLDPCAEKIRKPNDQVLKMINNLTSTDADKRASASLYFAGLRNWQPKDLVRTAGIDDFEGANEKLSEQGELLKIALSPTRQIRVHQLVLEQLCDRIAAALLKLHEKSPLRSTLDLSQLIHGFAYIGDDTLVRAALDRMHKQQRIKLSTRGISLIGQGPKLSRNEESLLSQLVDQFRQAGLKPPTPKECQQKATKNRDSVTQLIELAAANGDLVKVSDDFYLHSDVENEIRQTIQKELTGSEGRTLSEIREFLNTSRKYAVPLCEYYDKIGFTLRKGDLRVLP